ncbi:MAG: trypsin-like peptidase domain-containing protein [Candidatus Daviesbacteria bacterium]|nr:trypsin-like peptidase domain-containing protein [Candidatus Daviesbacteria bacterium]
MIGSFKTIIKTNKTTIIVSLFTSIFTVIVLISLFEFLIITQNSLFNKVVTSLFNKFNPQMSQTNILSPNSVVEESSITDIVQKTNNAVVSIIITKDVPVIQRYFGNNFQENNFFNYLFNNNFGSPSPQLNQNRVEKQNIGGGSGFFVSPDGLIVTNRHVVADDQASYTVLTNDGKKYDAEVLAKDTALDIAILKIKGNNFSYLSFGNSDLLKPGQTVIAIGNALAEFRNSVSVGVISGLSRSITAGDFSGRPEQLENIIQTDAAINLGNSGGPLLDLSGHVIGVNTAIEQTAQNIAFALPSNNVKYIVDSVQKNGEIIRPYLGIRYIQITQELKDKNNLSVDYGVLVSRGQTITDLAVIPGSPADKAGIKENDIILEIDGVKLDQNTSLSSIISQKQVNQTVKLTVLHNNLTSEITVKLEKAPKPS